MLRKIFRLNGGFASWESCHSSDSIASPCRRQTEQGASAAFVDAFAMLRSYRPLIPLLRLNYLLDEALLQAGRLKKKAKEAYAVAADALTGSSATRRETTGMTAVTPASCI
ncbi:MAG: hypothetical protein LBS03_05905 [Bacteroidales bacterium]|jgi:hypothetical protein|nr:hypothetical protein [Bacteroidales bacterium]